MTTTLVLRVGGEGLEARLMRRGRVLWTGAAPGRQLEDLIESVTQIAADVSLPARPSCLQVILEPPLVQVRILRGLPPVRRRALRTLVALQAGRFFRRRGEPLLTDAGWAPRTAGQERLAHAAALEERWYTAIAAGARAGGLRLTSVTPSGASDDVALAFVSSDERARQRHRAQRGVHWLAVATALTWVAVIGVLGARWVRDSRRTERELVRLRAPATAVIMARHRMNVAARTVETMVTAERERSVVVRRLAMIVSVLPDSSYLTSLTLDHTESGSMTGSAKQAPQVVAALERREAVTGARLVGPTVREVAVGHEWERFTIGFGRGGPR